MNKKRKLDYSTLPDLFDAKAIYRKNGKNLDKLAKKLETENKILENKFLKEIGEDDEK